MTRSLEKAVSFFTAIKHLKGHDCANFIRHLDDKGIYILCQIIHYVLNGELELRRGVRGRLRKKVKSHLSDFRKLGSHPRSQSDIGKRRKLLQRGGMIGVLSAIASAVIPLITQLLTR